VESTNVWRAFFRQAPTPCATSHEEPRLLSPLGGTRLDTSGEDHHVATAHIPRHTPYGATSRAGPPIPLAYLTTDQREELQRLEVEKSKQFLARSAAREIKNNIAQDERRLATLAQLNLQQAELDQKRAVLQRTVRPPGSTQPSMLTPLMPMLTIENGSPKQQEPATSLHKFVSNDKELSERFAKRFEGCFSNSDLIIPLNSDVNQTGAGNLDLVIPVNSFVTPSDFAIPVNSETIQTDMQKDQ
jgi:hypothetical protein